MSNSICKNCGKAPHAGHCNLGGIDHAYHADLTANTKKGLIDKWSAVWDSKSKDVHFHIRGFIDEKEVVTSRVIKIENNFVHTKNSVYELGFPKLHESLMDFEKIAQERQW